MHIIPINDLIGHIESETCECRPYFYQEMCVHHALDARDKLEVAVREVDTHKSLSMYVDYINSIQLLRRRLIVDQQWLDKKMGDAFVQMYRHWREVNPQFVESDVRKIEINNN